MKKNILILKQICKCIQKKTVLNQFYMNIQNGEIVNLIGMEDSGKEDVFSILFGQEKIDSGEIVFNRRSYTQMSQRIVEHTGGIFFINIVLLYCSNAFKTYIQKEAENRIHGTVVYITGGFCYECMPFNRII